MIHGSFFSLNSSFFEASGGIPRQVPFIRSLPLFRPSEDGCLKLGGRLKDCSVGFRGRELHIVMSHFLRLNKGYLWKSQVSLTRGHRVVVPPYVMKDCGIFEREQTYLSLPEEADCFPKNAREIPGFVRMPLNSAAVIRTCRASKDSLIRFFTDSTWAENSEDDKVLSEFGPVKCVMKVLRGGVTRHGPYSRMFTRDAIKHLGKFMPPRTFYRIYNRAHLGVRKGYIEKKKMEWSTNFVAGPVLQGSLFA
jgi:hypothetical protein